MGPYGKTRKKTWRTGRLGLGVGVRFARGQLLLHVWRLIKLSIGGKLCFSNLFVCSGWRRCFWWYHERICKPLQMVLLLWGSLGGVDFDREESAEDPALRFGKTI